MRIWRVRAARDSDIRRAVFVSEEAAREYAQKLVEQSGQRVTVYEEITTYIPHTVAKEEV